MKILLLSNQHNFISQLASLFKEKLSDFVLCALSENKSNTGKFAKHFDIVEVPKLSYSTVSFYFFQLPRIIWFSIQSILILLLNYKQGLKSFKCVFEAASYVGKMQHIHLSEFDIINVHYLTIKKAIAILLLPSRVRIVISFWGSDLFRTGGLTYNFWVLKALNRASTIHVSSNEMRMSLLSEFGYGMDSKIKFALFVPSFEQVNMVQKLISAPKERLNEFRVKYGVKGEKCIIVGNNGNPGNNHIPILKAIKDTVAKESITIILPLTYSLSNTYKTQLEDFIHENNLDAVFITEYIPHEDMATLKVIADIYITMQQTDAMSAFFTESLYSQSVCIAASWLPYSTFRQSGAYYFECPQFDHLEKQIEDIIENFENEKRKCIKNTEIISSTFYDKDKLYRSWEKVYER